MRDRPDAPRRCLPFVAIIGSLVILFAGCGAATPTPSAPPTAAPAPSSARVERTPTPSAPVASPLAASPGSHGAARGRAREDPSLIAVLPAEVAGTPVTLESQAFADALADKAFAANVAEAAFGVAAAGDNLASAVVARPVPGVFSESWFRDWRDSYNEGACAQSGGVAGTAETDIGGRTVFIATCAGGLRTYHARLEGRDLIVSAFSVGDKGYGEQLMAGLRP